MSAIRDWRARNVQFAKKINDDEKLGVLSQMDKKSLSMFHLRMILVAGMGFFCDAYDLFVISYVTSTIGRIYYPDSSYYSPAQCNVTGDYSNSKGVSCGHNYYKYNATGITPEQAMYQIPSDMPNSVNAAIKASALVGTFCGQIVFGILADIYGRRSMFGLSMSILVFAALGQGLSFGDCSACVIATLCIFRFCLGFGIGGDYPLSSAIMSEYSGSHNRGALVGAVFAQQGTGILVSSIVTICVAKMFWGHPESADYVWRIVLMFGALPAATTIYFRISMPETPRFTAYAQGLVDETTRNMEEFAGLQPVKLSDSSLDDSSTDSKSSESEKKNDERPMEMLAVDEEVPGTPNGDDVDESVTPSRDSSSTPYQPTFREFISRHGWQLLGTSSCWFLLDIAFYSQNFFQSTIYSNIGWISEAYKYDPIEETYYQARAALIIALVSTIPGYWFTVFFVDRIGRLPIQIIGFTMMTAMMVVLTAAYDTLANDHIVAFLVVYAVAFFFANFGPNATTFIIPAELYPTKFRSTGHGFSAGMGKLGAITGTFGFAEAANALGVRNALAILSAINFLGLCFTFFVPETKGYSLEELSGDQMKKKDIAVSNASIGM